VFVFDVIYLVNWKCGSPAFMAYSANNVLIIKCYIGQLETQAKHLKIFRHKLSSLTLNR